MRLAVTRSCEEAIVLPLADVVPRSARRRRARIERGVAARARIPLAVGTQQHTSLKPPTAVARRAARCSVSCARSTRSSTDRRAATARAGRFSFFLSLSLSCSFWGSLTPATARGAFFLFSSSSLSLSCSFWGSLTPATARGGLFYFYLSLSLVLFWGSLTPAARAGAGVRVVLGWVAVCCAVLCCAVLCCVCEVILQLDFIQFGRPSHVNRCS